MISAIFAAAAILASGAPANATAASTTAPADAAATEKAKADAIAKGNETVCRTEQVLGTKFAKRVCRTRADMAQQEAVDREMLQNMQNRPR